MGLNRFWLVAVAMCLAGHELGLGRCHGAGEFSLRESKDLKLAIYPKDSTELAVTVSVDHIFRERRSVGFFKVRLLPLVVVQGVRLDIPNSAAGTNWTLGFQARLVSLKNPGNAIEWRQLSVYLQSEPAPRLEAKRVFLPEGIQSRVCELKEVTLQTESGPIKLQDAQLQLQDHPGRLSWVEHASPMQWELFTSKTSETQTIVRTQKGPS